MSDRAKRRRPHSRALRLAAWATAIPLGLVVVVKVMGGFAESESRGWELVGVVGIGLLAILAVWMLMALTFGVPKVLAYERMRRRTTYPVYLARRPVDLPDRLTALLHRPVLTSGWDEFFVVVLSDLRLEIHRVWGSSELLASVDWAEFDGVSIRPEEFHVGRVDAIACTSRETGEVIAFLPHRPYPLGTSPMRGPQLIEVLGQIEQRVAASERHASAP
ncbi:hypothetical protein M3147_08430 [Agromyces mediolanus]|uniref:hypothetical protein n=1 Tax=Agromyces mediolanus TaxID=41986 RepID=UPI00203F5797|nr:hypothetical protein [Agromyces mediolanus]MCM3657275.1 hypothetical protein [Agromyces mediolanus]